MFSIFCYRGAGAGAGAGAEIAYSSSLIIITITMIIIPGDLFRDHHDLDHLTAANEHRGAID